MIIYHSYYYCYYMTTSAADCCRAYIINDAVRANGQLCSGCLPPPPPRGMWARKGQVVST